jgi:hypothetical protein
MAGFVVEGEARLQGKYVAACRHDSATLRIVARMLVLASLALALVSCAGKDASYTTEEVIGAFQRHGITLTVGERRDEGDILAPEELSFVVLVATEEAADKQWDAYLAQSDPDRLTHVRRTSSSSLTTATPTPGCGTGSVRRWPRSTESQTRLARLERPRLEEAASAADRGALADAGGLKARDAGAGGTPARHEHR